MKKVLRGVLAVFGTTLLAPLTTFAHVVVTPAQVNVGESQEFSMSAPNERDGDVTTVKLDIPSSVSDVMPDVLGGWQITTEKSGDEVSSITWTGTVPAGQRAKLTFKATVPAKAGEIDWKAYQTYADGTVISWNQKPVANAPDNDDATAGPYSTTTVADDLKAQNDTGLSTDSMYGTLALVLSGVAIVFSIVALLRRRRV